MSLEQVLAASQVVGAIAVVASLVFVGFQLRQHTRAVRASTSQAHSAMYHDIVASVIESGEVASIWRRGLSEVASLNPDELVRFIAFASSFFRFYEASHVQWARGQLDNEHWHTIEQQARSLSGQPGIVAWWKLRRHWHSAAFQAWFDSLTPNPIAMYTIDKPAPSES